MFNYEYEYENEKNSGVLVLVINAKTLYFQGIFNCVDAYIPSFSGDKFRLKALILNLVNNFLVSWDHLG